MAAGASNQSSAGNSRQLSKASNKGPVLVAMALIGMALLLLLNYFSITNTFLSQMSIHYFDAVREERVSMAAPEEEAVEAKEEEVELNDDRPGSLFDPIEITPLCPRRDNTTSQNNNSTRTRKRVIDAFFFNNELPSLELRLLELWNVVDIFFISESTISFKGHPLTNNNQTLQPKPLTLTTHWDDFSKFHSKMVIHVIPPEIVTNYNGIHKSGPYGREFPQRIERHYAIKRMLNPQPDDLVIFSDLDEIPRPHVIEQLACGVHSTKPPACLATHDSWYTYNYKCHTKRTLDHRPRVTPYFDHHDQPKCTIITNASTHCSSCFGSVQEVKNKIFSTGDPIEDSAEQVNLNSILQRIRNCKDVYLRKEEEKYMELRESVDYSKVPLIVGKHPERWPHLLGRGSLYDDSVVDLVS